MSKATPRLTPWSVAGGTSRRGGSAPRGSVPKSFSTSGSDHVRVEVARDDEARVGRRVVRREEVLHVVHLRGLQVLLRPDRREVVRVSGGIEQVLDRELGAAVRLVLVALPQLVQDDVALQVELLLVHRAREVLEPVGVEPEERGEQRGRAGREVVRAIRVRRGVVRSARRFHDPVELAGRHALRAHEHQVLEQVGEAAAAGRLVLAADAVPDVNGRDGQAVVRVEDHGHPVFQRELLNGEALRGGANGAKSAVVRTRAMAAARRVMRFLRQSGHTSARRRVRRNRKKVARIQIASRGTSRRFR